MFVSCLPGAYNPTSNVTGIHVDSTRPHQIQICAEWNPDPLLADDLKKNVYFSIFYFYDKLSGSLGSSQSKEVIAGFFFQFVEQLDSEFQLGNN